MLFKFKWFVGFAFLYNKDQSPCVRDRKMTNFNKEQCIRYVEFSGKDDRLGFISKFQKNMKI